MVSKLPRRFSRYIHRILDYTGISLVYSILCSCDLWLTKKIKTWLINQLEESGKNSKSLQDPSEEVIGTTLSGFLVAISAACLTLMVSDSMGSVEKGVFCALGQFSLLTSALMIDSILDRADIEFWHRLLRVLNGGYALFSLIVTGISAFILYLYRVDGGGGLSYEASFLIGLSSLAIFFKLMRSDADHELGPLLFVSYLAAVLTMGNMLPMSGLREILLYIVLFFFLRKIGQILFDIKDQTEAKKSAVAEVGNEIEGEMDKTVTA